MVVDLSAIEGQILSALGIVISAVLIAFGRRVLQWMNVKLSVAQKAELEDNASKALDYGISLAQNEIAKKGWDHADIKNEVIATATAYAIRKFPDSLARLGVDTSNPKQAAFQVADVMERKFAGAIATAAASPATPPVTLAEEKSV